jgi:hypothetical protein
MLVEQVSRQDSYRTIVADFEVRSEATMLLGSNDAGPEDGHPAANCHPGGTHPCWSGFNWLSGSLVAYMPVH